MRVLFTLLFFALITACSHPLEIVGEGDIVSSTGTNDCSLEEQPCDNHVTGDYNVTYSAVARSGWEFSRWQGCDIQHPDCTFNVPGSVVEQFYGEVMPPLVAIFDQGLAHSAEQGLDQQAYLKDSAAQSMDSFGAALDLSRNTLVVGIPSKDIFFTGDDWVTGQPATAVIRNTGAVSVFSRSSGTWKQQAYLTDGKNAGDYVAEYCPEGDVIIFGDHTYCEESFDPWSSDTLRGRGFGNSVAVMGDTIVVGAPKEMGSGDRKGEVYVFTRKDGVWSQTDYLTGPDADEGRADFFGHSLALSGDTLAVGAPGWDNNRGIVWIFTPKNGAWESSGYLKASNGERWDGFGRSIAISGDTIAVGAPWEDSLRNEYDNDASVSGAVYIFTRRNEAWNQTAFLKDPESNYYRHPTEHDYFGSSVAILGNTVAIGAPGEDGVQVKCSSSPCPSREEGHEGRDIGSVHIFVRNNGGWIAEAHIENPTPSKENSFGRDIDLAEDVLVVGNSQYTSRRESRSETSYADGRGLVQIFTRENGTWNLTDSLQSSNSELGDMFGRSPAISGSTIAVGANGEDSSASGGQSDNSRPSAGAAYVFE